MQESKNKNGITRRDVLKAVGMGAIYSMLPYHALSSEKDDFKRANGRGIIFIVGDGMPLGVIRAMHEIKTRVNGDAGTFFYNRFNDKNTLLSFMGTSSLSSIVTDSAPASVAWATGSKTANRMLSVLPDGRHLKTIAELAKENGYACGFVTTTRVTHATPAAWVSHSAHRDREDDIALDYLKLMPDVILGGGSKHFDSTKRKDSRDLFKEFETAGYDVTRDRNGLISQQKSESKRPLLGIFNQSHLSYYVDRINNTELGGSQPTLAEMTLVALKRLSTNSKGFILQIEAGRIDHANHSNDAWAAIMDTNELDITLGVVEQYLKANPDTLVILTSDHGNSGWGINGTGPDYNDATEALKKYTGIKASFEVMSKKLKGKQPNEIKDIVEYYTSFKIYDNEAAMIYESIQPGYKPYPSDFVYQPDATLGKILSHSIYEKNEKGKTKLPAALRRGNVGFTSTNHTGEDQIVLAYGGTDKLNMRRYVDNTDLFGVMCDYLGIKHRNPSMSENEAKPLIKTASWDEWLRHMELHIA
ncbi:alkaline phosphatase [hot springs metagenome]|uniref:Alkaline phosphatase n=1 Tax=hot springs metagenome TaxID=433727 RepID=A0A5J4KU03_9ZZZZ